MSSVRLFKIQNLAHDIATAVFRVSVLVQHSRIRFELEGSAVALVKDLRPENVDALTRLVRLAEAVGEVNQVNADVLCRELGNLRQMLGNHSAIHSANTGLSAEGVDLEEFFNNRKVENTMKLALRSSAERQKAIRQFIRQFPNGCRMKDISVEFPDFSERTLRSDIQKLINKGFLMRFGSRTGPFGSLKIMDSPDLQPGEINLPEGDPALPAGRQGVTKEELFSL